MYCFFPIPGPAARLFAAPTPWGVGSPHTPSSSGNLLRCGRIIPATANRSNPLVLSLRRCRIHRPDSSPSRRPVEGQPSVSDQSEPKSFQSCRDLIGREVLFQIDHYLTAAHQIAPSNSSNDQSRHPCWCSFERPPCRIAGQIEASRDGPFSKTEKRIRTFCPRDYELRGHDVGDSYRLLKEKSPELRSTGTRERSLNRRPIFPSTSVWCLSLSRAV